MYWCFQFLFSYCFDLRETFFFTFVEQTTKNVIFLTSSINWRLALKFTSVLNHKLNLKEITRRTKCGLTSWFNACWSFSLLLCIRNFASIFINAPAMVRGRVTLDFLVRSIRFAGRDESTNDKFVFGDQSILPFTLAVGKFRFCGIKKIQVIYKYRYGSSSNLLLHQSTKTSF